MVNRIIIKNEIYRLVIYQKVPIQNNNLRFKRLTKEKTYFDLMNYFKNGNILDVKNSISASLTSHPHSFSPVSPSKRNLFNSGQRLHRSFICSDCRKGNFRNFVTGRLTIADHDSTFTTRTYLSFPLHSSNHGFQRLPTVFKTLGSASFKPTENIFSSWLQFPQVHISCHVRGFYTLYYYYYNFVDMAVGNFTPVTI